MSHFLPLVISYFMIFSLQAELLSFPSGFPFIFLRFYFYLLFFREGKGGRKRGRETSTCVCLSRAPYWGPGPQPRHVPWLGIELMTLWFAGWCSIHWATPARARFSFSMKILFFFIDHFFAFLEVEYLEYFPKGGFSYIMKRPTAGQFSHFDICDEVFKERTIVIPSTGLD